MADARRNPRRAQHVGGFPARSRKIISQTRAFGAGMSARGWLGLALVLLALSGLAAVLPQGRTTLEELAPHASRAPSVSLDPDDLPTDFPTPTELPDLDISDEELQELLEQ